LAEVIVRREIPADAVVDVLRTYRLLSLLPFITKDIERLSGVLSRRDTIYIEAPFYLGKDALARVKRVAGNDLAPAEVRINKDILAGFKARYKGKLYDGSAERIIRKFIK
jgi:F0F1-type ATP synthase delta subunit